MSAGTTFGRAAVILGILAVLSLSGCSDNQYGPPVEGKPLTWGQQHYLNNQAYQQQNQDRMP